MKTLGFSSKWISLIMNCMALVSYSVVINGQPYGHIKPTRGLRQSDPLSPYLFFLCVERLSGLLNRAKQDGKIKGMTAARGTLSNISFLCG